MKRTKKRKKSDIRNPTLVAMMQRYGKTQTSWDRRDRRSKDARNDPRRDTE